MNRRNYLIGSLAASSFLGGCLALTDGGSTPTPRPVVAITRTDEPPDLPIRPEIEVITPEATTAGPPELRATVENTADYPIEVGEERAIVFAHVTSTDSPGLSLLPADGDYPAVDPGCWRLAEPIAVPEYYGVVNLEPGESTERRLEVWGSPDGPGCLPTGEFRFETKYTGARDRTEGIEDEEWSGRWGFALAVE